MDTFTSEQLIALDLGGNVRAGIEIQRPADYSSRAAVKYSECLKARVDKAVKDGYKNSTAGVAKSAGGAFIYSATGSSNNKPAWAK
jgi:hypothetical protein